MENTTECPDAQCVVTINLLLYGNDELRADQQKDADIKWLYDMQKQATSDKQYTADKTTDNQTNNHVNIPKRRGRPPGRLKTTDNQTNNHVNIPKRRARPPGRLKTTGTNTNATNDSVSSALMNELSTEHENQLFKQLTRQSARPASRQTQ